MSLRTAFQNLSVSRAGFLEFSGVSQDAVLSTPAFRPSKLRVRTLFEQTLQQGAERVLVFQ